MYLYLYIFININIHTYIYIYIYIYKNENMKVILIVKPIQLPLLLDPPVARNKIYRSRIKAVKID